MGLSRPGLYDNILKAKHIIHHPIRYYIKTLRIERISIAELNEWQVKMIQLSI
jgi:hypothetical protein